MEKVPTGVPGLDNLLEGGLPRHRVVLVSGACGTGKTIFCMQFLYKGVVEYNEPGLFVTFDTMPEKLREDMLNFGWDIKALERDEKLAILDVTSAKAGIASDEAHAMLPTQLNFDKLLVEILGICRNIGAKRLVIDSIPAMGLFLEDTANIRRMILKLGYVLSKSGLTTLLTSEIPEQQLASGRNLSFSKYEVEEYVADGVILMNFLGMGSGATRTLYIRKMRGIKHSTELHPIEIGKAGIEVKELKDVFK
jgi:KaiC/GvpD/RAD55 family RecA-like ATPase